jgi:mRNA interferase MazF
MLRGEIWWADLPAPAGSAPAKTRPVLIVQDDAFNRSRLATVVVVALTSQMKWAGIPGNVRLTRGDTGLPKASLANATQVLTVDRGWLRDRVGALPAGKLQEVGDGLRLVLGLTS